MSRGGWRSSFVAPLRRPYSRTKLVFDTVEASVPWNPVLAPNDLGSGVLLGLWALISGGVQDEGGKIGGGVGNCHDIVNTRHSQIFNISNGYRRC